MLDKGLALRTAIGIEAKILSGMRFRKVALMDLVPHFSFVAGKIAAQSPTRTRAQRGEGIAQIGNAMYYSLCFLDIRESINEAGIDRVEYRFYT